jgi:anti-sigma regulatory factor (Ser/Thr protein kinase)
VGVARHAVKELCDGVPPELREDLELVVSELVTNSIRHAGLRPHDTVTVTVSVTKKRVRVEVMDVGSGFRPPVPKPVGGWGLLLVSELADRWGVEEGSGTRVWCEMDRQLVRT